MIKREMFTFRLQCAVSCRVQQTKNLLKSSLLFSIMAQIRMLSSWFDWILFCLLRSSGRGSLSLCQLNVVIAYHLWPPAYIMHYLLQLGLFLSGSSWLRRRESTPGRTETKKLNPELFTLQFVGKSDYSLWYSPQNICDTHKDGIQPALWLKWLL